MDERTLGVHKIELVVDTGEHLGDGRGVGDHAHGALHLGEISAGDDGGGLVVDTALEASGAPVDELDGPLRLDGRDSSVDVLGDDVTTVHEAARHVLAVAGVALGHHGRGLVRAVGDLRDGELLVVRLLGRDDGSVRRKHKVDARVWDQIGLELRHIDVKGTIEAKGSRERGDDLGNQPVEVGVGRALNVERAAADVVDGFVIKHNSDVGVLEERVGRENAVVGFDDSGGHLGRGVHAEAELGLAAVVDGKTLEEERAESGSGATSDSVEAEESLETRAVVSELADAVEDEVYDLLSDGVVAASVVVGSILLAGDDLLGVVQLAVRSRADFIAHGGLEVDEDSTGNVLSRTSLGKEGVERIVSAADRVVTGHLAIRLDAVLEAVELPARVTDLDAGLTNVN